MPGKLCVCVEPFLLERPLQQLRFLVKYVPCVFHGRLTRPLGSL